jgi:acyl carrier protein
MTAHLGEAELARMRRQGVLPLPLEEGLALLDAVLRAPAENFMPVRLTLSGLDRDTAPALFRGLLRRAGAATSAPAVTLRDRLLALSPQDRLDSTTEVVLHAASAVLGLAPGTLRPGQVLKEAGLDSLMAVELRRRLSTESGLTLAATLAFDYPTPAAIAELLLTELGVTPTPAAADSAEDPEAVLSRVLSRLTADRIQRSGLLDRLLDLAAEDADSPESAALAAGVPGSPATAGGEPSVDDLNAELNALLGLSENLAENA